MMKKFKIIIILTLLITSVSLFSQKRDEIEYLSNFDKKPLRWGFYLGLNMIDYKIAYNDKIPTAIEKILAEPALGFNVGLIGDMRLHKNYNLRLEPGVSYTRKIITYEYLSNNERERDATSLYLYVPVIMQFSANRYKNLRPYVAGGVAYGHNFTSNFNRNDDNSSGVFRLQKHNFFYEIGAGVDFYLYFFKFSPSIRAVFAINNEIKRDEVDVASSNSLSKWTSPIEFMGSRGVFLRFTFQ